MNQPLHQLQVKPPESGLPQLPASALQSLLGMQKQAWLMAFRFSGNREEANDILQESCLKMVNAAGRLPTGPALRPWFFRVVANTALDARKIRLRPEVRMPITPDRPRVRGCPSSVGLEGMEQKELRGAVEAAIQKLEVKQRMSVHLHFELGLGYGEVARVLAIRENAARTYASRGVAKIRELLIEDGFLMPLPLLMERLPVYLQDLFPDQNHPGLEDLPSRLLSRRTDADSQSAPQMPCRVVRMSWPTLVAVTLAGFIVAGHLIQKDTRPATAREEGTRARGPAQETRGERAEPETTASPALDRILDRKITVRLYADDLEDALNRVQRTLGTEALAFKTLYPLGLRLDETRFVTWIGVDVPLREALDALGAALDLRWRPYRDWVLLERELASEQRGALLEKLLGQGSSATERIEAGEALGKSMNREAARGLLDALADQRQEVTVAACKGLQWMEQEGGFYRPGESIECFFSSLASDPGCQEALLKALSSVVPSPHRNYLIYLCGRLRIEASRPVLVQLLSAPAKDAGLRRMAAQALGFLGGQESVETLLAARAQERDEKTCNALSVALGLCGGDQAKRTLLGLASSEGSAQGEREAFSLRAAAVDGLGYLRDSSAEIPQLLLSLIKKHAAFSGFGSLLAHRAANALACRNRNGLDGPSVGAELLRMLSPEQSLFVRETAANALGSGWHWNQIPALEDAALILLQETKGHSPTILQHSWACGILARHAKPVPVEKLRPLLTHPEDRVRGNAAYVLSSSRDPEAREALLQVWRFHKKEGQSETILNEIGRSNDPQAIAELLTTLRKEVEPVIREMIVRGLRWTRSEKGLSALLQVIRQDQEPAVRAAAVAVLAEPQLLRKEALSAVRQALEDKDAAVRLEVVSAMTNLSGPEPVEGLLKTLASDAIERVRIAVVRALAFHLEHHLAKHDPLWGKAAKALRDAAVKDLAAPVRLQAIESLPEGLDDPETIKCLFDASQLEEDARVKANLVKRVQLLRKRTHTDTF